MRWRSLTTLVARSALVAVCVLTASCADDATLPTTASPQVQLAPADAGRYIVVLKDGLAAADQRAAELAGQFGRGRQYRYAHVFKGFAADLDGAAVNDLRRDPDVARVVREQAVYATDVTDLDAGWALGRIDQRFGPSDSQFAYGTDGTGVNIYVLGNGVQASHPDLGGRVHAAWTWDPVYPADAPCHNHETGIASIAAGAEFGVARNANIYSVRFNDCDLVAGGGLLGGGTGEMIAAIDWVIANHTKPAIMNLSWGLSAFLDGVLGGSVHHATKMARQAGIFVVVSAGNENADACGWSPANVPELMVVGATDDADQRASFSNYGPCLDLFAPGAAVDQALYTGGFTAANGTSFAAPFVAGAAALLYQQFPTDSPDQIHYAIRDGGTSGVVGNSGSSPNLLLYSKLPVPVYVSSIIGPSLVGPFMNCTWTADVRGGRRPYVYSWYGVVAGSANPVSGQVGWAPGWLNVSVTDALGGSAGNSKWIDVDPMNYQVWCS